MPVDGLNTAMSDLPSPSRSPRPRGRCAVQVSDDAECRTVDRSHAVAVDVPEGRANRGGCRRRVGHEPGVAPEVRQIPGDRGRRLAYEVEIDGVGVDTPVHSRTLIDPIWTMRSAETVPNDGEPPRTMK